MDGLQGTPLAEYEFFISEESTASLLQASPAIGVEALGVLEKAGGTSIAG